MIWELFHPKMTPEHLGFLPSFLSEEDPRPAAEQIDANYAHGGGWRPYPPKFKFNADTHTLKYPGDPILRPTARTRLRDETIYFYDHALVLVLQPDGSFAVARID